MRIRSRRDRGASLFAFRRTRDAAQGVLRGTQSPVRRDQEFSVAECWRWQFVGHIRYWWHLVAMLEGRGKTSEYREAGHSLGMLMFLTFRAHLAALFRLPRLRRKRRDIIKTRKITPRRFRALLREHAISLRQVAPETVKSCSF